MTKYQAVWVIAFAKRENMSSGPSTSQVNNGRGRMRRRSARVVHRRLTARGARMWSIVVVLALVAQRPAVGQADTAKRSVSLAGNPTTTVPAITPANAPADTPAKAPADTPAKAAAKNADR